MTDLVYIYLNFFLGFPRLFMCVVFNLTSFGFSCLIKVLHLKEVIWFLNAQKYNSFHFPFTLKAHISSLSRLALFFYDIFMFFVYCVELSFLALFEFLPRFPLFTAHPFSLYFTHRQTHTCRKTNILILARILTSFKLYFFYVSAHSVIKPMLAL